MRKNRFWIPVGCCVVATAMLLMAQPNRNPGLWEVTSTMTWQQSPFPAGMQMPQGGNSPFGGGPHTSQVCVTQEMIDRYGGLVPQTRGNCQITNVQKTASGMTADYACTGQMNGKGKVESNWSADGTSTSKLHFTGTMQMGPRSTPIEWTMESNSVFKGADCGSVKPMPLPPQ